MDRQRRLMRTPLFFRRLGLVSIGYSVGKERIGAYRGGGQFCCTVRFRHQKRFPSNAN